MRQPRGPSPSRARRRAALVLAAALAVFGCASSHVVVQVPPRLDLVPYGRVGLVRFTVEGATGSLDELATQRFEEQLLAAQTGFEVLELGSADSVLRQTGTTELGAAAAESLGAQRGVPAVFFGHLRVSNVQPTSVLMGLAQGHVEANVSAELSVQLVMTKSGGTVWRSSARSREQVGQVSIAGGIPSFSARDPNVAYGQLVNHLVYAVTRDFRPTLQRQ
jgi:hypothetical protein